MLAELGHHRGRVVSNPRGPFRYNLRFLPLRAAVSDVSPGALGIVDEYPYWNRVFQLYGEERLQEAVEVMSQLGIGMYGDYSISGDVVYIEAATSEESEIVRINEHLELECIREQLPFEFDTLGHQLDSAYSRVRAVFEAPDSIRDTLLTLFLKDAAIPTAAWRDGYFSPKTQYGKICLPMPQDVDAILAAFGRGLAYQFAYEMSSRQAENWVLEAATLLASPEPTSIPVPKWLNEFDLNVALAPIDGTELSTQKLAEARTQTHRIGKYLLGHGGSAQFVRFLDEHTRAYETAGIGSATERATKSTYRMPVYDLFFAASH
jgi:hypothetical protein